MPTRRRVATAAAALLAILSAACSSASPPATSTAPSDGLYVGRVTSERFGWSVELPPPEWRYRPATGDWPPHTNPLPGADYTDNFERPGEAFPAFDVSTQQLPADQTPDELVADITAFNEDFGCTVETDEEITVDGSVGRLQKQLCASGGETVWEVIVFDDDRVYAIYWVGLTSDADEDEPVFRQMMETFEFAEG